MMVYLVRWVAICLLMIYYCIGDRDLFALDFSFRLSLGSDLSANGSNDSSDFIHEVQLPLLCRSLFKGSCPIRHHRP